MDKKDIFGKLAFDSNRFKYITDHYVILNYDMYQEYNTKAQLVDFNKMKLNESITTLNILNNCEIEEVVWDPVNCKTEVYVSGRKFKLLEKIYERFVYTTRHQIQKEFDKHIEESLSEINNIKTQIGENTMTVKINDKNLKSLRKAIENLARIITTNNNKIVDKDLLDTYKILIDMYQLIISQQIEEN